VVSDGIDVPHKEGGDSRQFFRFLDGERRQLLKVRSLYEVTIRPLIVGAKPECGG